jgi:hypothetical protein
MIYHSDIPVKSGPAEDLFYRVSAYTVEALQNLARSYAASRVSLKLPKKKDTLKSRGPTRLMIHETDKWILEEVDSAVVPEMYLPVLYAMRKKEFYQRYSHDTATPAGIKHLDSVIRARIVDLAFSGEWVENPTHSGLEMLNQLIEKIDLGRYRGLKLNRPIPNKHLDLRESYQKVVHREKLAEAEIIRHEKSRLNAAAKSANPEVVETAFDRAVRLRREQGLPDY